MILITGCNGLLGSQLAANLVAEGHEVRAYVRPGADLSLLSSSLKKQINWSEGTLFDSYAIGRALEDVDQIIHAAAIVSFAPSRRNEMFKINVEGTACLVNEALVAGIKKFVHISSVAALGRPANKMMIDETDLWVEAESNTNYAKSKYLAELEVFRGFEEGLDGFVLNPSVILSPGDLQKSSAKLFGYVLKSGRYYTEGELNYVDVRDVCNVLSQLMRLPVNGERFILNAGSVSFKHFFEQIAKEFGKIPPTKAASAWIKELIWRIEYIRSLISGSEPLITRETARMAGASHGFNNQKIKTLLNYQFHSIDDSVHWVCQELAKQQPVHNLL
ncbi:MAG TPA: NAD-dependent epimerase/dehydratase family protein [Cytophagaceae bacterium]|jgi:dihydroflavonol-4-reductase|nr:NAD-dependent epimerase/dehydratase family protein [Cytophagaceae bacterium]